jgi:sugar phosphate isomerase/epimerase
VKPIGLQLYSLREESRNDFVGVLRKVAEIGFRGVEPAGFYGLSPQEFRRIVESEGMVVSSSHGPWAKPENLQEVIDTAGALGIDLVCSGFGPEQYEDMEAIKTTAEMVNSMQETLAQAGLKLFMHNHFWEYRQVEGRLAYEHFAELAPKVLFELDTYWAANFGANDPATEVARLKSRTPLLHIKDGPMTSKEAPMVACGQGRMDIPAVIGAADPGVLEWLIIELDRCATDMLTAVRESFRYLVDQELGEGR